MDCPFKMRQGIKTVTYKRNFKCNKVSKKKPCIHMNLNNLFPLHFLKTLYRYVNCSQMLMKMCLLYTFSKKEKNTACKFCQWLIAFSHVILSVNLLEAAAKKLRDIKHKCVQNFYYMLGALFSSWYHDLWTKYMELKRRLIPPLYTTIPCIHITDNTSYSKINILLKVQNVFEGEHWCAKNNLRIKMNFLLKVRQKVIKLNE